MWIYYTSDTLLYSFRKKAPTFHSKLFGYDSIWNQHPRYLKELEFLHLCSN